MLFVTGWPRRMGAPYIAAAVVNVPTESDGGTSVRILD